MRGGLDADTGRTGHIIGGIARQRLHIHHFFRRYTKIFLHFGGANAALATLSGRRIKHRNALAHQLHQILVRRDYQHVRACHLRLPRIGRDQVIGLIFVLLHRYQAKGFDGGAHQRKLRHQIFRRVGAVGFVVGIKLLAERVLGLVENDGQMRRLDTRRPVLHKLQHFRAKQPHRAGWQAIRAVIIFLVLSYRLKIGAENKVRRVHQKHMVAGADGAGMAGVLGHAPC